MAIPKISIGTNWPHLWGTGFVTAEVTGCHKDGRGRRRWTCRLSECRHADGSPVVHEYGTRELENQLLVVQAAKHFEPTATDGDVVRWIEFAFPFGLWAETSEGRWRRCKDQDSDSLVASGVAREIIRKKRRRKS